MRWQWCDPIDPDGGWRVADLIFQAPRLQSIFRRADSVPCVCFGRSVRECPVGSRGALFFGAVLVIVISSCWGPGFAELDPGLGGVREQD